MFSATLQAANEGGEYEWSWTTTDKSPGTYGDSGFARIRMNMGVAKKGEPARPISFSIIDLASDLATGDNISASQAKTLFGAHYNDFIAQITKAKK
jgi:hypothetical protein